MLRIFRKICGLLFSVSLLTIGLGSCNNYLDIVPDDGIATLETAFTMRSTAIRYLYTCYGFISQEGSLDGDHGYMSGDEFWSIADRRESTGYFSGTMFNVARGFQNAASPYGNDWNGIYEALRCCNIMIERANTVPDLPAWEAEQWVGEAKVLKAYYHFHLMRKWGPIPLIRTNLPIDASMDEVRVYREPIDTCFDYVIRLLDEAIPMLPVTVQSRDELGRITRPIAAAFKARVAVYAASPLFNNNLDQASLEDKRGVKLFDTDKTEAQVQERWKDAMDACKEAIDICREANLELYEFDGRVKINDTLRVNLTLRNMLTEKWNSEAIWSNTHTPASANRNLQMCSSPNLDMNNYPDMPNLYGHIQAPYKVAEQFYTNHGVPMANDLEWLDLNPLELRKGDRANRWYIKEDYTTIQFCFNREPRFYASLGFDGGIWFGQQAEKNDPLPSDLFWVACRANGAQRKRGYDWGPVTGFYNKKVVHYQNNQNGPTGYSSVWYPFPIMRLADLYLLYAEAINEYEGPNGAHSDEMFAYVDSIRARARIPGVKEAWDRFSNAPGKYSTKIGMREIIHRERLIELFAEGQRFWDLRRWKEAYSEYAKGIYGFKVAASKPEDYYQLIQIAEQKFALKDYFWPIQTALIEQNPNLVQNIGW